MLKERKNKMFLNRLKDEQKGLFLELAIKAAESSCGISKEEREMIKAFAKEMNIPVKYECEMNFEQITNSLLKISSHKDLRIITFEIIGIMYSDSTYDETERAFVKDMAEKFSLEDGLIQKMEVLLENYSKLYSEIYELIISHPIVFQMKS